MGYRDDEENLRDRLARLEERVDETEALRRRVAELEAERARAAATPTPAAPSPPPALFVPPPRFASPPGRVTWADPDKSSAGFTVGAVVVLAFVSLQLTICGPSCVPPETPAIAWLACPSGYRDASLNVTNSQRGQSWNVVCHMPHGRDAPSSEGLEILGSFVLSLIPAAIFLAWRGARRVLSRPRAR